MTTENVHTFTTDNFEQQVLTSPDPVLVDFHAKWCPPCRMLAPTIDELAQQFEGRARVGKVDVDANPELARTYDISSIPAIFVFRNGRVVDRVIGLASREDLARVLERVAA